MTYTPPIAWEEEEISNLYDACNECLIWAERYNDKVLLHQIELLMDLALLRMTRVETIKSGGVPL